MLRTVIHKQTLNVFHIADDCHISNKDYNFYHAFYKALVSGNIAAGPFVCFIKNKNGKIQKKRNRKCNTQERAEHRYKIHQLVSEFISQPFFKLIHIFSFNILHTGHLCRIHKSLITDYH